MNTEEIIEASTPMNSVTAKPLTEPVPKYISTMAAMMVVTFESMMEDSAFL